MKSYQNNDPKVKITFETDDPFYREASKIQFDLPADMNIHEFRNVCVRMAGAIGYHEDSINRAFGESTEPDTCFDELLDTIFFKGKKTNNAE